VQILAVLSIIGILYGALVSLMQQDWKKLVAYSSVSHLGFCTLGIFALNPNGLAGSVIQQINHGISTGMLFLVVGVIYERRHTREIKEYGGLAHVMPNFAIIFAIAMLSSAGLPLLNGFVGEFTILQGAFEANRIWAAFAVLGRDLGRGLPAVAVPAHHAGRGHQRKEPGLPDLTWREWAVFVPLIAWAIWIGVYPKPYFDILAKSRWRRSFTASTRANAPLASRGQPSVACGQSGLPPHPKGTDTPPQRFLGLGRRGGAR
jgi:NADH-quinone oxidoreductase subunit M